MNKIAVIGLGYVGLPLALLAEEKGFSVLGLDLSKRKLDMLSKKVSPIDDKKTIVQLKKSKICFSDDLSTLSKVDIAVICVPTPVDENKIPDLTIVRDAAISAAKNLNDHTLLVIESTINPGVCDEVIIPAIEKATKHIVGKTLHLAHCPERINPGDKKWHVGNINRVIGADSEKSLDLAYEFYTTLINAKIKKMGSLKEAEAVKIVENSFRDINIAFVNELAMSFDKLEINVVNVIDGAATKPFAFMAHYPGIGVGGHCIPVDPYYLIEYARNNGFEHHFLSLARNINEGMPIYAVDKTEQALIEGGHGSLNGKTVSLLGLSYKANVGDDRESPSYAVLRRLEQCGAIVKTYDPFISKFSTEKTLESALTDTDAIILSTAHREFSLDAILESNAKVFLDGRNVFSSSSSLFTKHNIHYLSI